jgi:Pentapeptide repeats (8 copies)
MADGEASPQSARLSRLAAASTSIRDAAKWMVASSAAVGAVLIAGSQVSSIGKLEVCVPGPVGCNRLWVALLGAVTGLGAVVYAIWQAVRLLLPVSLTLHDLEELWAADETSSPVRRLLARLAGDRANPLQRGFGRWLDRRRSPVVRFFTDNPGLLQHPTPNALRESYNQAWKELKAAEEALAGASRWSRARHQADVTAASARFDALRARIQEVTVLAQYEVLRDDFARMLARLLIAAVVAAIGIVAFAWAANPPEASPAAARLHGADLRGAMLRDADLDRADLTGADLSRADLTGATLDGAVLTGVTWSATTCPDGTSSDDAGGTCRGHLSPR